MKSHINFNQILDCFYVSDDVMWFIQWLAIWWWLYTGL